MITSKHGRKHEARPPGQVKKRKEKKSSVSVETDSNDLVIFVLAQAT